MESNKISTRKFGEFSESIAINILKNKGFKILTRNYFILGGEIDIITKSDKQIVFVEVKSMSDENYIFLEQSVSKKKKDFLIRACKIWLLRNNMQEIDWRIDFIGIILDNNKRIKRLLHFEGAIY